MQAETAETSETVPLRGISEATAAEILAFRDDRRWLPYHNPKDLAMSVAIEAGELLEVFQWSGTDLERGEKRGELADELGRAHDESVERLKADVERLQAAIDRYLILQGRPRRYAVRLNERNEVLALLVLEH